MITDLESLSAVFDVLKISFKVIERPENQQKYLRLINSESTVGYPYHVTEFVFTIGGKFLFMESDE